MMDWNQNGKQDMFDQYVDYNLMNHIKTTNSESSSGLWRIVPLIILFFICPPVGVIAFLVVLFTQQEIGLKNE